MIYSALFSICPAFLMACFLFYSGASLWCLLTRKAAERGSASDFDWHFFVPCRDEEAVIGATLASLRVLFPAGHVWVVDDDSDDDTHAIVAEHAERDDRVHLVQRRRPLARVGKSEALNAAYAELGAHLRDRAPDGDRSKVLVCVLDADGRLAPDALDWVAGPTAFGDPRIGGAQVSVRMRELENPRPRSGRLGNALARLLVRLQDVEAGVSSVAMQMLRVRVGSVGLGGNGQFTRLSALDDIAASGEPPWRRGALIEDYELGVRLQLHGHRLTHIADTWVSQEGLPFLRRLLAQRTRWAQGNLQCFRYLVAAIRSPRYRVGAVLETLHTLIQPLTHLLLVLLGAAVVVAMAVTGRSPAGVWPLTLAMCVCSAAPFICAAVLYRRAHAPQGSLASSLARGVALWLYSYHLFPVSARAVGRTLSRRTGWLKTRRNAEPVGVGPVAVET